MPGTWESRGSQGPRNVLQMGWFTQEELNNQEEVALDTGKYL